MNNYQVIKIKERLDSENVANFKAESEKSLQSDTVAVILDFSSTKFIDSIGLGSLVSILKQTAQQNKSVVLASISPHVRQIFELTKLYRLFDIFESVDDAKNSLSNKLHTAK